MKKTAKRILAGFAVLLFAVVASSPYWLADFVLKGHRQTYGEAMEWQAERYDVSFYEALEKTDYTVPGEGGYELHVQLLANPQSTDKYVIVSHGYTDNRNGALKYVPMYLSLGYNCIVYDLRGHGENASTVTTYGLLEGRDLAALAKDTRTRYPDLSQLGLHGESLGAATSISALAYRPEVDFVVADCGFADIDSVLRHAYGNFGVPSFVVDVADFSARHRYGYSLDDMRPIDALEGNTVPVLFVHGAQDDFIVPDHSRRMLDKTEGPAALELVPGAGHAESVLVAPEDYRCFVEDFLGSL